MNNTIDDLNATAMNYMIQGTLCDQREDFVEANENYNKCINTWEKMRSSGHKIDEIELAKAYMNRGSNYYFSEVIRDLDKALSDFNTTIRIIKRQQKENIPLDEWDVFMAYKNRSQVYEVIYKEKNAIKDIITALDVLKKAFQKRLEFQTIYYGVLKELIELIKEKNDDRLLKKVLNNYLYSMHQIPKVEDAEIVQNELLNCTANSHA